MIKPSIVRLYRNTSRILITKNVIINFYNILEEIIQSPMNFLEDEDYTCSIQASETFIFVNWVYICLN